MIFRVVTVGGGNEGFFSVVIESVMSVEMNGLFVYKEGANEWFIGVDAYIRTGKSIVCQNYHRVRI